MAFTSVFRGGAVTILSVAAVGAAMSALLSAQSRESRELVVLVLANGQPVPKATVDCRPGGIYETDKGGRAACRLIVPTGGDRRSVAFTVHAPGFAVEAWAGEFPTGSTVHTVGLVPEVPVSGRVFDPQGQPLAGAAVTLRMFDASRSLYAKEPDLPDHRLLNTQTDKAGRFTIKGARNGRIYRLAVDPFGPLAHTERFVQGGAEPIDVRLPAKGTLQVDFTAPPGLLPVVRELLSDSTLEWRDENGGPWRRHFVSPGSSTQGDHLYAYYSDLPAGIVRIVTPYRGPIAGDASEPVSVIANTRSTASMRLVAAREVRLRVLDAENQPATDALLVVTEGRGRRFVPLDADGWATIAVHPSRDATVIVRTPGYPDASAVIAAGVQNPPPIVLRHVP